MYRFLDSDNSGTVDMLEFVTGALKLKGPARCLDIMKIMESLDSLNSQMQHIQQKSRMESKQSRMESKPSLAVGIDHNAARSFSSLTTT